MAFAQLRSRVLTAIVLVAVFVGLLVLSAGSCQGHWLLVITALAAQCGCAFEFSRISARNDKARFAAQYAVSIVPGICVVLLALREGICSPTLVSFVPFALATGVFFSFLLGTLFIFWRGREDLEAAKTLAVELYPGLLLVALGGGSLVGLAALPAAAGIVAWLFLVVCVNDIAAYFGGSHFKGPKIVPALSPNKTASGYACGMLCGILLGVYASSWLDVRAPLAFFILFSFAVVLAAQVGDLLKSYLKRNVGVKDSGSILPGHGGLLDRLDGALLAGPLVYLAVIWLRL
ncbi:MAG: phosphatidate cytidylyltransferase [Deltaproteobacteria bacterium]|nr:phosphatidate cytidylyltransferase [Deltaproteobacteria bacterium]